MPTYWAREKMTIDRRRAADGREVIRVVQHRPAVVRNLSRGGIHRSFQLEEAAHAVTERLIALYTIA